MYIMYNIHYAINCRNVLFNYNAEKWYKAEAQELGGSSWDRPNSFWGAGKIFLKNDILAET